MHRIQWDPERYDYLSDHPFWLSTWSVWDLSERGAYIEVRCFSFLSLGDLQLLCWTCYGIYTDSRDIRDRLDEYGRSAQDSGRWQLYVNACRSSCVAVVFTKENVAAKALSDQTCDLQPPTGHLFGRLLWCIEEGKGEAYTTRIDVPCSDCNRAIDSKRILIALHLSRKIILANLQIWCSKMQPLSGNQRPGLLTCLMNMSFVLGLPRKMHLCRSSSNVPRLPSFLEMRRNPCHLTRCTIPCGCHAKRALKVQSGPNVVSFVHFDLEMCFALQRRALFRHLNFQKWSGNGVFCTFSLELTMWYSTFGSLWHMARSSMDCSHGRESAIWELHEVAALAAIALSICGGSPANPWRLF